jgi:uncharacterized protein YfiM (DUF2279 family)
VRALVVALAVGAVSPALAAAPDPWWAPDKALHFAAGSSVAMFGYTAAAEDTGDRRVRLLVGAALSLTVGAAKELMDLAGYGTPSWKDFAWDAIGCVVGLGLALAIDYLIERFSPAQNGSPGGRALMNLRGPSPSAGGAVSSP